MNYSGLVSLYSSQSMQSIPSPASNASVAGGGGGGGGKSSGASKRRSSIRDASGAIQSHSPRMDSLNLNGGMPFNFII